jgi:alkanesulfonate monooxygenase SsuD/methylene tetrahydromethanopterin reductase-like flavin-dependent oxidoreductase (luciferase family)
MDVGIQMTFTAYGWSQGISDAQVYEEEIALAKIAADVGFDVIWSAEHHFYDYSICPDNTVILSYLAGACNGIDVGTAAIILPYHNPLEIAERVAVLDQLCGGRLRLGLGRGLARREYAHFPDVDMAESRERFDESAALIVEALRTGSIEGSGRFYPQPKTPIRPRPQRSFSDRLYAVASSDESVEAAAGLGARLTMFADRPWSARLPGVERYQKSYRLKFGQDPPPLATGDFTVCLADPNEAEELGSKYLSQYLPSLLEHYEVTGTHFESTTGYESYAKAAEALRSVGLEGFLKSWLAASAYGTPDQVLKRLDERRSILGSFDLLSTFRFGGMPPEVAERSLRLFASEVIPVLKTWT